MANILDPTVSGKIQIDFSCNALLHKTREERNKFLTALREKIGSMLDEFRAEGDMIEGWYIELFEKEEQ